MSIDRYLLGNHGHQTHPSGVWVKYEDHKAVVDEMLEALERAFDEMNAVRARDGAPISPSIGGRYLMKPCPDKLWDEVTNMLDKAIAKAKGESDEE